MGIGPTWKDPSFLDQSFLKSATSFEDRALRASRVRAFCAPGVRSVRKDFSSNGCNILVVVQPFSQTEPWVPPCPVCLQLSCPLCRAQRDVTRARAVHRRWLVPKGACRASQASISGHVIMTWGFQKICKKFSSLRYFLSLLYRKLP